MEPIPSLPYLERYRNQGTRTYSRHAAYTEADDEYRPDSTTAVFDCPVFELPVSQLNIYRANPPADLASRYLGAESARICVHPQLLARHPD